MRTRIAFLFFIILTITVQSQDISQLHLNKNNEFKVVQFTDTHINVESGKNVDAFTTIKKLWPWKNLIWWS